MLRVSSVVCWHAYADISSALPQGGRSASGKPAVLPSHCSMEAMTAELRAPRRMTGQRDGWRRHAESGEDRWFDCAGKRAAKLSLLFPRENRVPVIPISLRNRFLALAPAEGTASAILPPSALDVSTTVFLSFEGTSFLLAGSVLIFLSSLVIVLPNPDLTELTTTGSFGAD